EPFSPRCGAQSSRNCPVLARKRIDGCYAKVRTARANAGGFTLVEILVVMAVIAILAAVSVPLLLDVQMAGREASAISSLRTIHSAQEAFRVACGDGKRFASTLPQLGAAGTITKDLSVRSEEHTSELQS